MNVKTGDEMQMIKFLGAAGTVTGSKTLLQIQDKRVLVDCGLFQGLKVLRLRNWQEFPFDPRELDAVLLTHAHIDHSGLIPLLVKRGYRGKIYCTHATQALCAILLPDTGHLQEEDADFANRHGYSKHHPALPLFTMADAKRSLSSFKEMPWNEPFSLGNDLSFAFKHAGHILGASLVELQFCGKTITFSGDLGREDSLLLHPPETVTKTDYLVLESTYGNRNHPKIDSAAVLADIINTTVARGGTVLIPAFAVGRAQELLYLIHVLKRDKRIADVPIFLNSPMAVDSTHVVRRFQEEFKIPPRDIEALFNVASFISSVEESRALNDLNRAAVIISASGMATGGRVLHHLKTLAPVPKNTILLVGFQAAGTRGEALLHGASSLKIHGQYIPVAAEVRHLNSLSAHADADGIMAWLKKFKTAPRMTFINHGEPLASDTLRKRIQDELHWNVVVPDQGEEFYLDKMAKEPSC